MGLFSAPTFKIKETCLITSERQGAQNHKCWCFYPGGRGSEAPELGACCCLGLAPSVVTGVLLLPPSPDAFPSPGAGEGEEDEDEGAGLAALSCADEDGALKEAAPPSEGLAAEEASGGEEAGRG